MNTLETDIPGLLVIEPDVYGDDRGFFMETWRASRYRELGLPGRFVQSNVSRSDSGVVRGLHYQQPHAQGKLVSVLAGHVFDVAVDIRPDSPTFRKWAGVELSAENKRQLYVPEGFAHGFCVLGESALLHYFCTEEFRADCDAAIAWNDPDIGVRWPLDRPRLSAKDAGAPRLKDISEERLPCLND